MNPARVLCRATLLASAAFAIPLRAQVGTEPLKSPYRDMEFRQEWTTFAGYFDARADPASVAPQGGAFIGERYAFRMGGPAYFTMRVAGSMMQRNVVNPQLPLATRRTKTEQVPLVAIDAGFEMQLTGSKTWHSVAPVINGGVGFTGDLKGTTDVGGFQFGYPFTFTFGSGLKYVRHGGRSVRLDWSSYVYRLHYPDSYYLKSTADPAVLQTSVKKDLWRRNNVWTLGITIMNFR